MALFEIRRHLVYSMQSGANPRTIKRYHHQLLNVEEQALALLGNVWPEVLECGARHTGECFCGANRDVKLWMRIHGSLVLVELDALLSCFVDSGTLLGAEAHSLGFSGVGLKVF